jgi:hypothetical protein
VSGERERLAAAAARLEDVTAALAAADVERAGADELARLAEAALALSAEIGERVPRAIAEAEAAAETAGGEGAG